MLIARLGCGASEAFTHLREVERRSGGGLLKVAAQIVGDATAVAAQDPGAPADQAASPGVAAMQRSADADELAWLLVDQTLGRWRAAGAAIALLQSDGALEIAGAAGLPASWVSQWRRIPPAAVCLLTTALREGQPAWSDEPLPGGLRSAGRAPAARPGGLRVAIPLRDGRRLLGCVEIAWAAGSVVTSEQRAEIIALAQYVGPALIRTLLVTDGQQQRTSDAGPRASLAAGGRGCPAGADRGAGADPRPRRRRRGLHVFLCQPRGRGAARGGGARHRGPAPAGTRSVGRGVRSVRVYPAGFRGGRALSRRRPCLRP